MVAPKGHPTYCRWHENLPEHPKTRAAARVLVMELGIDGDLANAVICRAVPLLVTWLIRNQDDGRTDGLSDARLASIAWPASTEPGGQLWGGDAVRLAVPRRALRAIPDGYDQGFLVVRGRGKGRARTEHLHEFVHHAWPALRNRPHYKGRRLQDLLAAQELARGESVESEAFDCPSTRVPDLFSGAFSTPSSDPSVAGKPATNCENQSALRALPERASNQEEFEERTDLPDGRGWRGVPVGVFRGEMLATAEWIRRLPPSSYAGLLDGSVWLDRYRRAHPAPLPTDVHRISPLEPGRLFEAVEPSEWAALIGDLAAKLPATEFPKTYAMKSLAQRWGDVIGKLADAAQARRAERRQEEGGTG